MAIGRVKTKVEKSGGMYGTHFGYVCPIDKVVGVHDKCIVLI
jgi:hypothetical protein